jgi:hypothetical protein
VERSQKYENRCGFVERIQLAQVTKRFLPRTVRDLAQNVPLKDGLAVIGRIGTDGHLRQHRGKLFQHHGPADMRAAGRELEAEGL